MPRPAGAYAFSVISYRSHYHYGNLLTTNFSLTKRESCFCYNTICKVISNDLSISRHNKYYNSQNRVNENKFWNEQQTDLQAWALALHCRSLPLPLSRNHQPQGHWWPLTLGPGLRGQLERLWGAVGASRLPESTARVWREEEDTTWTQCSTSIQCTCLAWSGLIPRFTYVGMRTWEWG